MKLFSEYIKESYSFRLGGSQQKGYGQARVKTFAELKNGDEIYYWSSNADKAKLYTITGIDVNKNGDTIIGLIYNSDRGPYKVNSKVFVDRGEKHLNDTCYYFIHQDPPRRPLYCVIATNEYDFLKELNKYRIDNKIKSEDIIDFTI